jgi:hypothetical protein
MKGENMDKKERIQMIVIVVFFLIYSVTAIFRNLAIMQALNYICGYVLSVCFFIFALYQNRVPGRKKWSRFFIIISVLLIGLNLI